VLAFATGVSLLAGIVFGLIPALQLSRSSALENLKQATRSATAGQSRTRLGSGVLVAEVGLSLLLATGAGLMIRSMIRVEQSSLGFEPARILTLGVSLPPAKYQKPADQLRFFEDAIARIQSLPGVRAAAAVRCLHMAGECWSSGYTPEDRIGLSRGISFNSNVISPRYFEALGIPVIQGRAFTEHDTAQSQPVAIVNQTLSRKTMAEWHRDW
jgi:putative ABC transport system permease protein